MSQKNKAAQSLGKLGGQAKSPAKTKSSRANGAKGGRPKTFFAAGSRGKEFPSEYPSLGVDGKVLICYKGIFYMGKPAMSGNSHGYSLTALTLTQIKGLPTWDCFELTREGQAPF